MDKLIELAKKLKALADRGVDGEKRNAAALLEAFMKKHNISDEEIYGEQIIRHQFNIKKDEFKFFNQIVRGVRFDLQVKWYGNKKSAPLVDCTAAEYLEIIAKFEHYSALYKKELRVFYLAFLEANKLLATPPDAEKQTAAELSVEEQEIRRRASSMSQDIKRDDYKKRLNEA